MFKTVEDVQKLSKENLDVAAKSLSVVSQGLQTLAADAAQFSKTSFEFSTATFEKLIGAKSLDKAVEIHSDYALATYEQFIAQTRKVGDIVTDIAKESYRPFEGMLAKSAGR